MNNQKITLNGDDVLSVNSEDNILISHHTYTVEELLNAIGDQINYRKKEKWCVEGVPCKMLAPNQSWQKGKVKISIEFIPDEIESPLDELRKEI
ncbi:KGK family protein [Hyella patelloides LEGE 07179]|uniref:KGK family protein n=1 Tax=Hyella patelloides LEGE 07179 TaxID=945734 RepID=A0A563VYU9_9CYAN|nr:KGK domain-containing protein [Hyella patelloides]VEP16628.1 KGK family protein [Hyella patelloides LEGE 07179]